MSCLRTVRVSDLPLLRVFATAAFIEMVLIRSCRPQTGTDASLADAK